MIESPGSLEISDSVVPDAGRLDLL